MPLDESLDMFMVSTVVSISCFQCIYPDCIILYADKYWKGISEGETSKFFP